MKSKGFTLIELLAIIVILAIIAVITVPIILNIIESAKEGSSYDSTYGIIDTAKMHFLKFEDGELNTNSFTCSFPDECNNLNYNGKEPTSGEIRVSEKGMVNGEVTFYDKYTYCINNNNVIKGTCADTIVNDIAQTIKQPGIHDLDSNKIYNCIQFDIEVKTGTTLPFCVIGETNDTVTLILKDTLQNSTTQWANRGDINNWYGPIGVFEKILEKTKDWTKIPAINNYTYDDNKTKEGENGYNGVTIIDGKATITQKDSTTVTIGNTSSEDTSNQLRARTLTKEEAINITQDAIPKWLQGIWTITSDRNSAGYAWLIKNKTLSTPTEIKTWAISDSYNVKPVITLSKNSL